MTCYLDSEPPPFTPKGWLPYNQSAAEAIRDQLEPGDLVCLIGGQAQGHLQTLLALAIEFGMDCQASKRLLDIALFSAIVARHE